MTRARIEEELQELGSVEEFLNYFGVPYDERIVQVNRLHILQRFHDYLARSRPSLPGSAEAAREVYRMLLQQAYHDFVNSSAVVERVFKVFRDVRGEGFVAADSLGAGPANPIPE